MKPITTIASFTILEAVRAHVFTGIAFLSALLLSSAYFLRELHFGDNLAQFLLDSFTGINLFFGGILTIALVSQLFQRDLEHRWLLMLLSRPVNHHEVIIGKALGIFCIVALFVLLNVSLLCVMLALGVSENLGQVFSAVPRIATNSFIGLVILGCSSLVIASFASSLFTHLILSLLFTCGMLLVESADRLVEKGAGLSRIFGQTISLLLPDLAAFFKAPLLEVRSASSPGSGWDLIPYGLLFVALYLFLAILILRKREL